MYKAIYFDLDNTLTHRNNSIWSYSLNLVETFRLQGIFDAETIFNVISFHDNGGYLQKDSIYSYVRDAVPSELSKLFSSKVSIEAAALKDHWNNVFPECSQAMPGAYELLDQLYQENFHIGLISNGAQQTRVKTVDSLGFGRYFKQLASSELLGIKKPNPEIFTIVAKNAGLDEQDCIYVGDHPLNDIDASRKGGMTSVWLKGFHNWPSELQKPQYSIDSLSELISLVFSVSTHND